MILDALARSAAYAHVQPGIAAGLKALREGDYAARTDGKYPIDGDRLFALVQTFRTKLAEQCIWEAHRKYIDVQYVVSGTEVMGQIDLSHVQTKTPYNPDRDAEFFHAPSGSKRNLVTWATVSAGTFAVFFPHDVHSPMIAPGAAIGPVKKVVLKVAV
jgi:YhcH/YjgK/YiaL family protein